MGSFEAIKMGVISKIVLLWVCVNAVLLVAGFNISADQGNTMSAVLGDNITSFNGTTLEEEVPVSLETGVSDSSSAIFVDTTRSTFGFWNMLKNVFGGSFIALIIALELDPIFLYMISVPLTIIFIIALIEFLRGISS